jgi:hypothetical protein
MKKIWSVLIATFMCFALTQSSAFAQDDYLNDLINMWNNHKYEKVYTPLKDYKASKKIVGDFEIDYMIASSLSRMGGDPAVVHDLVDGLLKEYTFSKDDETYVRSLYTCDHYVVGKVARVDGENVATRGSKGKSKNLPKVTGKGTGQLPTETAVSSTTAANPADTKTSDKKEPVAAGKDTKTVTVNSCPDIVRNSKIPQIVRGNQVITVKPGYTYIVRNDSTFVIPPPGKK